MNLTAVKEVNEVMERHVEDSLAILLHYEIAISHIAAIPPISLTLLMLELVRASLELF